MPMTMTIASAAAQNCSRVCARQSASTVDVLVVATTTIGKCVSDLTAPTLSSDSLALVKRPDMLPSIASARWNAGVPATLRPISLSSLRIAGDDGAVAMNHRDRGVAVQRQRTDKVLEMGGLDAPAGKAR